MNQYKDVSFDNFEGQSHHKRSNKLSLENLGTRIPPHSIEAEVAVIGAMMLDKQAIAKIIDMLEPDSFYQEKHKIIYQTMQYMFEKRIEIDIVTLGEELYRKGLLETVGGNYYIAEINKNTPTAANIEQYAKIVQERFLKRNLIASASKIIESCYNESSDALEEVDRAETEIFKIAEKRFHRDYTPIKPIIDETVNNLSKLMEKDKRGMTGIPSGFKLLDDLLGGFQNSDFIVIAGRPSMGKTAFALSVARNAAVSYNFPIAFFSIEMAAAQLAIRLISAESHINAHDIRTGNISHEAFQKIIKTLDNLVYAPIIIDDSPRLTLMEFRAKCRRLKTEHDIKLVLVDYLQLMQAPKAESREREISLISQSLKQIAKELNIPIIALAQLNRSVESRADKRPMLSDLRESGSIEQDADVVMFVNRLEHYGIETYEDKKPTEGTAEIIIGKQRNGPVGIARLAYLKDFARFENLAFSEEYSFPIDDNDDSNDDPGF